MTHGGRGPTRARLLPDDAAGRAAAIEALRAGGLVAMPTDTVYGVGVALDEPDGLPRLFAAKERPFDRAIVSPGGRRGSRRPPSAFSHRRPTSWPIASGPAG